MAHPPTRLRAHSPRGPPGLAVQQRPDRHRNGRQQGAGAPEAAEPREFAEFGGGIHPRDQRVFFGAYDPDAEPIGLIERLGARLTRMPAIREALPAGDFRDWLEIEAWAEGIARELQPVAAAPAPRG